MLVILAFEEDRLRWEKWRSGCGAGAGGGAATVDAFVLTAMLGHRNVAVYDNSMQEWSNDPNLPMETG